MSEKQRPTEQSQAEKATTPWRVRFTCEKAKPSYSDIRKDLLTACWNHQEMADLLYHLLVTGSWKAYREHLDKNTSIIVLQKSHAEILARVKISEPTLISFLKAFNQVGYVRKAGYQRGMEIDFAAIEQAFISPPQKPSTSTSKVRERLDHPALQDVNTILDTLDQIAEAEARAKELLHDAIRLLPAMIGDNQDLAEVIASHLYWRDERVHVSWLREAFDLKEIIKNNFIEKACVECGSLFHVKVNSRGDLGRQSNWLAVCEECQEKERAANSEEYEARRVRLQERNREFHTMPYPEYLQTPEWQERRKRAVMRAGFRCQVCNAFGVRLNVHHRTYERRGYEHDQDLITLCEKCHQTFHDTGELRGAR